MSIQSKTATGIEVKLTGTEDYYRPVVLVSFVHPKLGKVEFRSSEYGQANGQKGIIGIINGVGRSCVTVPIADFDAAMDEARLVGEKDLADLKSGAKPIQLDWQRGEPLSGWIAGNRRASDLLMSLGLAKDISGWGTLVEDRVHKALGATFTFAQAVELVRPQREAAQAKSDEANAVRQNKIDEAVKTGKRLAIRHWCEMVDDAENENSLDIVIEYAMPNGTTLVERCPTH